VNANEPLADRTVLILGGAGKMGRATARLAALAGARLILVGRSAEALAAAIEELPAGSAARSIVGDATDDARLHAIFEEVGAVDHIVAATSSGTAHLQPPDATIPRTELATAKAVYSRLWAAYNALHFAPRYLRAGGSVTLISGSSAKRPQAGFGVYGAMHGAIEALARAAAIELAPLRVNVVSPGGIGIKPARQLAHHFNRFEDLAAGIIAVLTNPAITGAVLDVDGGEFLGTWSGEPARD
jgi:NAD(P)-dependent dehydrogenase (short-subunit alcohol dehydrogenase family)